MSTITALAEAYETQLADIRKNRNKMREALERVRDWKLPDSGYERRWGSQGAKDYIRSIAHAALENGGE